MCSSIVGLEYLLVKQFLLLRMIPQVVCSAEVLFSRRCLSNRMTFRRTDRRWSCAVVCSSWLPRSIPTASCWTTDHRSSAVAAVEAVLGFAAGAGAVAVCEACLWWWLPGLPAAAKDFPAFAGSLDHCCCRCPSRTMTRMWMTKRVTRKMRMRMRMKRTRRNGCAFSDGGGNGNGIEPGGCVGCDDNCGCADCGFGFGLCACGRRERQIGFVCSFGGGAPGYCSYSFSGHDPSAGRSWCLHGHHHQIRPCWRSGCHPRPLSASRCVFSKMTATMTRMTMIHASCPLCSSALSGLTFWTSSYHSYPSSSPISTSYVPSSSSSSSSPPPFCVPSAAASPRDSQPTAAARPPPWPARDPGTNSLGAAVAAAVVLDCAVGIHSLVGAPVVAALVGTPAGEATCCCWAGCHLVSLRQPWLVSCCSLSPSLMGVDDDEISPTTARITQKSAGCHRKSSTTGGGRLTEKDGIGGR